MNKLVGCAMVLSLVSAALGQTGEPKQRPAKESGVKPAEESRAKPAAGESRAKPVAAREALMVRLAEVEFQDAALEQVMDWLAEQTGVNVHVRWQTLAASGIERDRPISVKLRNLRLAQVLWMILREAGGTDVKLGYQAAGNLLIISTRADLDADMIVKAYDVRDLLVRAPQFRNAPNANPAQMIQQGNNAGGARVFEPSPDESGDDAGVDPQSLVDLIVTTVEPGTWERNGGQGTIVAWEGRIIVRNSRRVHDLLGGTLQGAGKP